MNYRTILMATATVLFAGVAQAEDITSPFYLPGTGKLLSNTSVQYDRTKLKHNARTAENLRAAEEVTYGITNDFSVVGAIGNMFDFKNFTNQEYNNDHNFDYTVGAKYNMNYGNWLAQVGGSYYTFDSKSWYGHRYRDSNWDKEIDLNAKAGYMLQDGWTPYTSLSLSSPIDQNDRPIDYSWFNGFHKTGYKYSVDAGIRYDFVLDGSNTNTWWAQAEANYFIKDNVTVGIFGDYYIGGSYSDAVDYSYTLGVNAKVLF